LLFVLICVGGAVVEIGRIPRAYVATAQVFVTTSDVKDASGLFSGNQFAQSRVQTYVSVVTSPTITAPVRDSLSLSLSDGQLAKEITADAPLNKTLVNIHVRDSSASRAAQIANGVASQFIVVVKDIETQKTATTNAAAESVLKLTVIHPASAPTAPVAPQKKLILLVGFFGGLFLGLLAVVLRERLNTRLRSPLDVGAISTLPLLGAIPIDRRAKSRPNAFQFDDASPRSEAFRLLRTNLRFVDVDRPPKVIAITSPVGGEGKTAVALNLAVSLAEVGLSVCLVEADLRQPVLAQLLELDGEIGLTSLLSASAPIDESFQYLDEGLSVVTSGPLPRNPSELLDAKHLRPVLALLSEQFDYVVLDASSLLPVVDGVEVVSAADATVLVVRAGETSHEKFRRCIDATRQVGGAVVGVVMNRSPGLERIVRARGATAARTHIDDVHPAPVTVTARLPKTNARSGGRRRNSQGRRRAYDAASAQATVVSTGERSVVEHVPHGDESGRSTDPWLLGE